MLYTSDGFSSVKWRVVLGRTPLWGKHHIHIRLQSELKNTQEKGEAHKDRTGMENKVGIPRGFYYGRGAPNIFSVHIYMYIYLYKYTYIYIWSYDYTWFLHILKNISLLNRGFWHLDCAPLSTPGPGGEDCRWLGCCSKGIQHGTRVNDMKQQWWVSNNMYK